MATVNLYNGSGAHPTRHGNTSVPQLWELDIDFAKATTAKGSALANADVLTAFKVPAGSVLTVAGVQVLTATNSTDVTAALGDGTNTLVAASALNGVAAGTYLTTSTTARVYTAETTVSVTLGKTSAFVAPTSGKIRVFLTIQDITDRAQPGRAVVGS